MVLQRLDPHNAVHQVSGEAAHRLCYDEVNFSVQGVRHELLKTFPVLGIRPGKTIVDVGTDVLPVRIGLDFLLVFLDLEGDGDSLVQIIGGNTAVCRHAEDLLLSPFLVGIRGDQPDVAPVQSLDLLHQGFFGTFMLRDKTGSYRILLRPCGAFRCNLS